ncbi:MAG: hypothetical protein AMXMBFR48_22310 [Ignavibacteriales bacterium]
MSKTKKILFILLGSFFLIVSSILVFAATKPDTFRVERSLMIPAPPEVLHTIVSDFRTWEQWSPWEKLDPNMKKTFSGPVSGPGQIYAWEGNDDVGKGRMEILESNSFSMLKIKLEFIEPFPVSNTTEFNFTPAEGGTKVVWAMYGESPYISKLFSVFMDMDTMIGKDFDEGLNNLKALLAK